MLYLRILCVLFVFPLHVEAIDLVSGYYELRQGDEAVCPQELVVHTDPDWGSVYLEVVYVGDCYYMGPYEYYCQEDTCSNAGIVFEVTGKNKYHWKNRNSGHEGDFVLKDSWD